MEFIVIVLCICLLVGLIFVIKSLLDHVRLKNKNDSEKTMIHFLDALIESYHKGKDFHYHIQNRNLSVRVVMGVNDLKRMKESSKSFINLTSMKDLSKHCDYVLTLSCVENGDLCEISVCDKQNDFTYARQLVIS